MRNYTLRCCEDKIGISILGVTTTPNCFNTSRIHYEVSRFGKMVQMTKYRTRFLTVIGKKNGNQVKMDQLAKYVHFILTENEFLLSKLNQLCVMGLYDYQVILALYWWTTVICFCILGKLQMTMNVRFGFYMLPQIDK